MERFTKWLAFPISLALFLLALAVTWNWPPHKVVLHIGLSLLVGLFGALYVLSVPATVKRNSTLDVEHRLQESETIVLRARAHPVKQVGAVVNMVISAALLLLAFVLLLQGKQLNIPHPRQNHDRTTATQHPFHVSHWHISVWYFPALFGLLFLVLGVFIYEKWRCSWWVITNQRFVEQNDASPLVPFLVRRSFDPTQLSQVFDVNDDASYLGDQFGWGKVVLKIRDVSSADRERTKTFMQVPDYNDFADKVRQMSPLLNGSNQRPPRDPLDY